MLKLFEIMNNKPLYSCFQVYWFEFWFEYAITKLLFAINKTQNEYQLSAINVRRIL